MCHTNALNNQTKRGACAAAISAPDSSGGGMMLKSLRCLVHDTSVLKYTIVTSAYPQSGHVGVPRVKSRVGESWHWRAIEEKNRTFYKKCT